jgi:hypothetical protein
MMPVRQNEKTAGEVAKTFWRIGTHCPQITWRRNGHLRSPTDYRRNLAGTMRAQGKSWAEIAGAVGGSEWSAQVLVRRYRTSLAEPTGPAPSPTCGAGL